ncbi:gamma-glutamyl-gamma-aminobutyrate hydrolase family protein [Magnetospirillum fulvum]|uniref:Putative glutamine amidotransferase n=1 Tax=Magnetospirillum fulvum TaxID=1082 RepID=A0A1H6I782_MAGFU|nr:gamma-glutamyl-gamma-aminobutyrate hydrolase family protein [Magnetospirillum fulvum]SEH44067.1 putative glutamine amidotransferase [Magnetospirillum fulvum]
MSRRPIIGITLDSEESGGYSTMPWYALRCNYCESVAAAGGLPVSLPHHPDLAEEYLDRLDALIVSGGAFDVDPALFGADSRHPAVTLNATRTAFELRILTGALARDLPILGICGGQQLLNVALGGSLIQHIPDEVEDALVHEQPNPRTEPGHEIEIVAGTRLAAIVGTGRIVVNSAHHQAVKQVAPGCIVDALAPDGVIEGIEAPDRRFCIGVQWHPEFLIGPADAKVLSALVEAARQ